MSRLNLPKLVDISLDISNLVFEYRCWEVGKTHKIGAIVKIQGIYRPGSAGKNDATVIQWRLNEFYDLVRFHGLVVDCRELQYQWGDDLILQPTGPGTLSAFPFRLIIHPEQQEAFAFVETAENHRFDIEAAIAEIHSQLNRSSHREQNL